MTHTWAMLVLYGLGGVVVSGGALLFSFGTRIADHEWFTTLFLSSLFVSSALAVLSMIGLVLNALGVSVSFGAS